MRPAVSILMSSVFSVLCSCQSQEPPKTTHWRTMDEGTFTFEAPHWLRKREGRELAVHGGAYSSRWMGIIFEEGDPAIEPPGKMSAENDALARAFRTPARRNSAAGFIQRDGKRYFEFDRGDELSGVADANHPLKYAGALTAPNPLGGSLTLAIFYGDHVDSTTVLRIAKSLRFKE